MTHRNTLSFFQTKLQKSKRHLQIIAGVFKLEYVGKQQLTVKACLASLLPHSDSKGSICLLYH